MTDTSEEQKWTDTESRLQFRRLAQRCREARDRLGGEICLPLYHPDAQAIIWLDEHLSDMERTQATT